MCVCVYVCRDAERRNGKQAEQTRVSETRTHERYTQTPSRAAPLTNNDKTYLRGRPDTRPGQHGLTAVLDFRIPKELFIGKDVGKGIKGLAAAKFQKTLSKCRKQREIQGERERPTTTTTTTHKESSLRSRCQGSYN
jgi:hypothetical protein